MPSPHERKDAPKTINWLGPLHGGKPDKKIWSGNISLAKLGLPRERVDQLKEMTGYYFVKASAEAAIRCIDGRLHVGTLKREREDIVADEVGPQVPGGTPGAAVSFRLADFDYGNQAEPKLADDILHVSLQYSERGLRLPVGSHEDDHAQDPFTGCGAIDRMPEILERMYDEGARPALRTYVEAIVGEDFSEKAYEKVMDRLGAMVEPGFKKHYLDEQPDGEYAYRKQTIEATRQLSSHDPIETMEGDHKEIFLVVNKLPGETFHRDLFCYDTDNEAQVFNYDYWSSIERANVLYGEDDFRRQKFLIARAMYAVATAMVLTDGSLEVGVRG